MSNHWMKMFWSSPSFCRIDAMFSGVATLPAIRSAGSPPGIMKKMRYVTKLTASRTRIIPKVRRMRNATI